MPTADAESRVEPALPQADGSSESAVNPANLIAELKIVGNQRIPTHHILRNIRTREGRLFDPDLLQQDIDSLWKLKEIRRINGPFVERTAKGLVITIEVTERAYIRELRFIGNRAITDQQLKKHVDLKAGAPLDAHEIRMARQQIEDYYHQNGYPLSQVEILEGGEPEDEDVVFLIHEDSKERVWAVEFEGNQFASDARLKTFVKTKPGLSNVIKGFAVERSQIEQDVMQLTLYYRQFGFFNARIAREIIESPDSDWIRLRFVIDEGPRYRVRNVSFVGNKKYTQEQLLTALKLKPDGGAAPDFNAGHMNTDVNTLRDLYGSEGHVFASVEVESRFLDEPGLLDLVYKIDEGNQYRVGRINVHIEGEPGITKWSVIMNRMTLQPGDIIDVRKIRNSERLMKLAQVFADGSPGTGAPPRIVVKPDEVKELERFVERESEIR
jgi:outer membrane protein insertion porin family